MHPLPPLDWLRAFEASARHSSFTAAAEELGLTQAAVSQHIRKLEGRLGASLFRRLPRGVELTADGAAYLPHVQAGFDVISRSTGDLFARDRRRPVKLVCPPSFAALWLAPRLPRLLAAHAGLRVGVATILRQADYEAEAGDIEVRFGMGDWPALESALLVGEALSPVAAPAILAPGVDWTALPLIAVAGPRDGWSPWSAGARVSLKGPVAARFDTTSIALEAARAGAGVLLASLPLAAPALASGALRRLHAHVLEPGTGHWLARERARRRPDDAEAVWQWMLGEAHASPPAAVARAARPA